MNFINQTVDKLGKVVHHTEILEEIGNEGKEVSWRSGRER